MANIISAHAIAAGRMQQLIEDLLAFSRINTTEHEFEKHELWGNY